MPPNSLVQVFNYFECYGKEFKAYMPQLDAEDYFDNEIICMILFDKLDNNLEIFL